MTADQGYVAATAAVTVGLLAVQVGRKAFDPFAPVWLFLVGYFHLYVIQAVTLREWAVDVRGGDLVEAANLRALWALLWYLGVYYCGAGKVVARHAPRPPAGWSGGFVTVLGPALIAWGLYCAYAVIRQGSGEDAADVSAELAIFRSFPFVMLVAGVLFVVTGNRAASAAGVGVVALYVLIWTFNGKRSHSVIGVLAGVCAVYVARQKRPSWPVLLGTACAGSMVVALAIGWRNNDRYDRSASGFIEYLSEFKPSAVLASLTIEDADSDEAIGPGAYKTYETEEYGGFLVMLDTVPEKAEYDYGESYLRCVSTYIPRPLWPSKPLFGRAQWLGAWVAGSELKRDDDFTGPAIGVLGAAQLNGGAVGTLVVMAVLALAHRTAYEYFVRYPGVPIVQAFWALTYYNAWMQVANDDPMVWFYYNWGLTCLPVFVGLWVVNSVGGAPARPVVAPV